MHTYPHKIENGEGEVITFLGVVRDRDGDRMEVELLAPPNVGTPMHLRAVSFRGAVYYQSSSPSGRG